MEKNNYYLRNTALIIILAIFITLVPLVSLFTKSKNETSTYLADNSASENVIVDQQTIAMDLNISSLIAKIVE
ncbi:hypothetical protein [Butyrivibrio sp. WCD3002]|uniref:hypothetical protein n=1 Tax=Butyrivibrio sp. WCD3002 TaxID=1280676 RepID=UPI000479B03B|nr:hypothetical protein [Butyrivibrio sp. WCD3002]